MPAWKTDPAVLTPTARSVIQDAILRPAKSHACIAQNQAHTRLRFEKSRERGHPSRPREDRQDTGSAACSTGALSAFDRLVFKELPEPGLEDVVRGILEVCARRACRLESLVAGHMRPRHHEGLN